MKTAHKFTLCVFLFISFLIFINLINCHPFHEHSNSIRDSPNELKKCAILTLDQIISYPNNYTYSLSPLFDNRYFGSNMFELNITQINGSISTEIKIEIGQYLNITANSELSNFTIAKQEWINLTGLGDSGVVNLTVFDINVAGEIPKRTDTYKIVTTKAAGNLLTLLTYIDNKSLHNAHHAQLAVWAVSDGPDMIPAGFIYNNTEVDWANAILANAGLSLTIPYMPTIPGFNGIFLIVGFGLGLLTILFFKLRRRDLNG